MTHRPSSTDRPLHGGRLRPRQRDAAATRAAILLAARSVFAERSYDAAGVREIAGRAGVTAALVNRYFGSKRALFTEAVLVDFPFASLLDDDREASAERLAAMMVREVAAKAGSSESEPLRAILRSAPDPEAGQLVREWMEQQFVRVLARWLGGPRAAARAALLVSTLVGYAVLGEILEMPALARARPAEATRMLAASLHAIMIAG